jgi:hypothetical protein
MARAQALGDPQQREAWDLRRVDHRLEIRNEGVERDVIDGPIRQPVAAGVVPDQRMLPGELAIEMPPDWAFEVVFQVSHPVARLHQRRSPADL